MEVDVMDALTRGKRKHKDKGAKKGKGRGKEGKEAPKSPLKKVRRRTPSLRQIQTHDARLRGWIDKDASPRVSSGPVSSKEKTKTATARRRIDLCATEQKSITTPMQDHILDRNGRVQIRLPETEGRPERS